MFRDKTGCWLVNLEQLPPPLCDNPELAEIRQYEDLLKAHARAMARLHAEESGVLDIDIEEHVMWVCTSQEDFPSKFRYRLAREQEEGLWGSELEHARALQIRDRKKQTRKRSAKARSKPCSD